MSRDARRLRVAGRVQGVGFRPTVVRLARREGLAGWVRNTPEGVLIHLEGPSERLAAFPATLSAEAPPQARIETVEAEAADPEGLAGFTIRPSALERGAAAPVEITPDLATCPGCLAEALDPANRRFGYALNACTDCGPRFAILLESPFDRARTTMAAFPPCEVCRSDYENPDDRRFHAQNVACPRCGPRFWIEPGGAGRVEWHADPPPQPSPTRGEGGEQSRRNYAPPPPLWGRSVAQRPGGGYGRTTVDAVTAGTPSDLTLQPPPDLPILADAAARLRSGQILAVKGIGGVHLMCDATDAGAIAELRSRKNRPRKPLAVLFETIADIERAAILDDAAREALASPAAPIVLVPKRPESGLAPNLAPGLNSLGVMRAYAPYQVALLRLVGRPLVATSANASDEPMPIDEATSRAELAGIADGFLFHDRAIVRHADDSVVRPIAGRAVALRIGRGMAPLRLVLPRAVPPMLAVGGHLKAAIALARGRELFLGQHVGNLDTPAVRRRYRAVLDDLRALLRVEPALVACDTHPDYETTRVAATLGPPVVPVQHHAAHVFSCLAEHGESGPALGVAWDGTGYGDDGSTWGGEFLLARPDGTARRVGSIAPFRLVGGDRAAREPRRCAAGACEAAGAPWGDAFTEAERRLLAAALASPRLSTLTTSVGRLFDAWAFFCGVGATSAYEGEPAMRLEELADPEETGAFAVATLPDADGLPRLDWRPWAAETRESLRRGVSPATLAARFHNALARGSLEMARRVGCEAVVLTGGCFGNRLLAERTEGLLAAAGFRVLTHRRVPPGDGGLAVGQLWAAALRADPA
jgi:hydrogenase maturation protein HypF